MSFLMRIFFLLCFGLLAGTGIVAGLNLAVQDQAVRVPQSQVAEPTEQLPATSSEEEHADTAVPAVQTADQPKKTESDNITASAYLVGNVETGKIYFSKHPESVLPVASISKLVTAMIATDTMSPTTTISVASTTFIADLPGDGSGIHGGESFELKDILEPLLLSSSNIAAEAIASTSDRDGFLNLMYSTAWEIGMPKTFFADPSGLDPENQASAKDLFSLAKYLYQYRPDILAITRTPRFEIASSSEHDAHIVESIHPFVSDPRFIGGKTGRTPQAGETMLTLLDMNDGPIVFIVMHSDYGARQADTNRLIARFLQDSY